MALSIGSRLGPYEVLGALGAGGMGEVYRARDTRLDRTVAIKILPAHLCASPEARQRFDREARTISQLSHPHICALFDVGHQDGVDYLVMEYLDGELLSDRLAKGALPLEQTLRIGIEIADALQRAHRQGIVHRDLKPANVMLTRSGTKLLDFGLAKVAAASPAEGVLTALPTRANLTQEGTILGTVQYMAPEQLEGKEADARTDLFALGAVLYEMTTGKKAFSGASHASLISAIMKEEPAPPSSVHPMSPPALDHVVKTCLAKDPEDRWQSANDIKNQLRWIAEGGSRPSAVSPPRPRSRLRELIAWGIAGLALLAVLALFLRGRPETTRPSETHFSILVPGKSALRAAVISPDGSKVAIVARDASGKSLIWIRRLDSLALQALEGTENPSFPFWSPDSRFLGFFADGKLKRIDPAGGPPQTISNAPISRGGTWGADGTIVFTPIVDGPLFRVSSSGGPATALTKLDPQRGETTHRWPFFLPDGRHFLYLVGSFASGGEIDKMGIYVRALDSGEERFLLSANSSLAYAPPGRLLFARERNLLAQPFDLEKLTMTGDPFPVAEDIQFFPQTYYALFSSSRTGTVIYQNRAASTVSQLVWLDRAGKQLGTLGTPGDQSNPHISPDGRSVTLDITDPRSGNMDVWVYETSGGIAKRLTSHPGIDSGAIWSSDGSRLIFSSLRKGHADLYQKDLHSTEEELLLGSDRMKYATDISPDGRTILFRASDATSKLELWTLRFDGDHNAAPFIKTNFGVGNGQFSPDGRFVAYASDESGRREVYVAPFPGPGGNWRVSSEGGSEPKWRRDGKELFYIAADGHMMAVTVREGASFDAELPRPIFPIRRREPVSSTDQFSYDVASDGQRFLVNTDLVEETAPPLQVILNWAPAHHP
jgi:serine/threonine protein kinase